MLKKILTALLVCLIFFTSHPVTWAQTATTSATTSSSTASNSATTQKLKERIEKIVDEKRDQIAGVLDEITGQRRGYIGEVLRITSETMTLRTLHGTRIVSIRPSLTLMKGSQTTSIDQVAIGDWAIVIGSLQDDEIQPERIIISGTSLRPKPQVVTIGTITAVSATSLTLTERGTSTELTFTLPKSVKLQDINGEPIKSTQLSTDIQAVIIGQRPTDETLNALIIRILIDNPQPVSPKPTTSPRPSPTPAAR